MTPRKRPSQLPALPRRIERPRRAVDIEREILIHPKLSTTARRLGLPIERVLQEQAAKEYILGTLRKTGSIERTAHRLGITPKQVTMVKEEKLIIPAVKRKVARVREIQKPVEIVRPKEDVRLAAMKAGLKTQEFRNRVIETVKRDSVEAAAEKWGLSREKVLYIRRNEIIRLHFDEGLPYRQIAPMFKITGKRVGQICKRWITPEAKRLIQLKRFIKKHNPRIKEPKALEEFIQQNYYRKKKVLVRYLGIEESAVKNLISFLGLEGKILQKRKEVQRQRILKLAERIKARDPKKLSFGYLFKQQREHRQKLLSRIFLYFAENPEEYEKRSMKAFDRFLKAAGLTRGDVGMRKPSISRKEARKRILEYISEPCSYSSIVKGEPYMGSEFIVPGVLKELVAEGKLKRTKIGRKIYFYKPWQEKMMEQIVEELKREAGVKRAEERKPRAIKALKPWTPNLQTVTKLLRAIPKGMDTRLALARKRKFKGKEIGSEEGILAMRHLEERYLPYMEKEGLIKINRQRRPYKISVTKKGNELLAKK